MSWKRLRLRGIKKHKYHKLSFGEKFSEGSFFRGAAADSVRAGSFFRKKYENEKTGENRRI